MRVPLALLALLLPAAALAQDGPLWQHQSDQAPRWASPENPTAEKGAGGRENKGAKGHAFDTIPAGGTLVLADIKGPGIIDRMWMTTLFRTAEPI